jgi:putative FmdB family regulatory protein
MPLYEYLCTSCGSRFERIQKFSDPPVTECPSCGGRVEKQISSPAIQFKGAGWYVTDYAKSGTSSSSGDKSKTDTAGAGKSGDSTKSESTPKADAPAAKPTTPESK